MDASPRSSTGFSGLLVIPLAVGYISNAADCVRGDIRSGLFVVLAATVVMLILRVLLMLMRRKENAARRRLMRSSN